MKKEDLRIVFMGTPEFAVPILQSLIDAPQYEVKAVLTQPDHRVGRKHVLTPSPVKKLAVENDISKLKDFDVIYTDTWVSMGDNTPLDTVRKKYMPYQINQALVDQSGAQIVMHCLPAHRGYEITDEVMDGPKSVVFDEAENRLHIHMAVLAKLINA